MAPIVPRGPRLMVDVLENLVLAERRCDNDERDLLPGPAHVTAWVRRRYPDGILPAGDHGYGALDL